MEKEKQKVVWCVYGSWNGEPAGWCGSYLTYDEAFKYSRPCFGDSLAKMIREEVVDLDTYEWVRQGCPRKSLKEVLEELHAKVFSWEKRRK